MYFDTYFIEMFEVIDANYAVAFNSLKKLRSRVDINKAEIKAIDNNTGVIELRTQLVMPISKVVCSGEVKRKVGE